ncbi:MAG: hypothetical protein Q4G54_00280 [Pelistega sp.]|nr:hypothetical protein [Pelistega sp.]
MPQEVPQDETENKTPKKINAAKKTTNKATKNILAKPQLNCLNLFERMKTSRYPVRISHNF